MRVTRIEVFGFKSFMDRVALPFTSGVTGVVGPNGCGKSNIVDAVRWVLGEKHAKHLRGAIAEDVIFNGTEKLRPLGLAEVSITLKAESSNFFEELTSPTAEVDHVIKQAQEMAQLERELEEHSDEEDEEIEGAKDQTGPQLTVIDGALSENGLENDQEEVVDSEDAGSPADELREQDKEKQEGNNEALSLAARFSWLKAVSEVQLTRRLYRSGESEYFINQVPCRLKDITELCRAVGLGPRAYTIVAQGQISRIITSKPEERRLIIEEAAGVVGFRSKINAAEKELKETEIGVSRLDDIIKEISRQVGSLKRQANRAKNREGLLEEIDQIEKQIHFDSFVSFDDRLTNVERTKEELKLKEVGATEALVAVQENEESIRSELVKVDVDWDDIRSKLETARAELKEREYARELRAARVGKLEVLETNAKEQIEKLTSRIELLVSRLTESASSVAALTDEESGINQEIASLDKDGDEALKAVARDLQQNREALRNLEREVRDIREQLVKKESQRDSAQDQLKASSPLERLKKSASEVSDQTKGIFVDGLDVPTEYVKAVQAVLEEQAGFIVAEDAKNLVMNLSVGVLSGGNDGNEQALGVLDASLERSTATSVVTHCALPRLLDKITVSPGFETLANRVLGDIYVASSVTQAYSTFEDLSGDARSSITIVTTNGDIITDYSFKSVKHNGGLVQLKTKVADLNAQINTIQATYSEAQAKRDAAKEKVSQSERAHQEALEDSQRRAAKLRELTQRQGTLRGRLQAEQRLKGETETDKSRIATEIESYTQQLESYAHEKSQLSSEVEQDSHERDQELNESLQELEQEALKVEATRNQGREKLGELSRSLHLARTSLDSYRSQLSQSELEVQKLELERSHITERIVELFSEETLAGLRALSDQERSQYVIDPLDKKEMGQELSRLKNKLSREGDVDPTAIARFEEESARLESLETQKKDLEEAHRTIRKTIERLSEISKTRFIETFNAVNENFATLVPQLYGGGSGKLELIDPSRPLESGVEITARPPGKKLKSIELLSGGEKAMCALALIVGMFLERPSPLLVLDEVDAPLDEANVGRFLAMVQKMSDKTQFLVITHNKQSMAACDTLVGVTMQQPGATTIVNVSLEEAVKHAVNS